MSNGTVDSEFITKEAFDTLQKEVKALKKAQAKQSEPAANSTSISIGDLKGLQAEIIKWVVGIMIAFGALILIVLDQRIGGVNQRIDEVNQRIGGVNQRIDGVDQRVAGVNQRIDDIKEDINANKVAIAENKVMIQQVLDKLDDQTRK